MLSETGQLKKTGHYRNFLEILSYVSLEWQLGFFNSQN